MSIRRTITDGKHMLRHASTRPAHPGKLLREIVIPATNLSKSEVALLLGISRQHLKSMIRFAQCRTENRFPLFLTLLCDIMAGRKPVTPETAIRLGKLFGDGPAV